jgi:hypothetical protein
MAGAAPLLCAGITVYSPLRYYGLDKPGMKVGRQRPAADQQPACQHQRSCQSQGLQHKGSLSPLLLLVLTAEWCIGRRCCVLVL